MKKGLFGIICALIIAFSPILVLADSSDVIKNSDSTYTFSVVEETETPLAGDMELDSFNYIVYIGAVVALLGVGLISKNRIRCRHRAEELENTVAVDYMDDLIK